MPKTRYGQMCLSRMPSVMSTLLSAFSLWATMESYYKLTRKSETREEG